MILAAWWPSAGRDGRSPPSLADFLAQVDAGTLRAVEVRTRDHTIRVTPEDGDSYTVGYPQAYGQELIEGLEAAEIPFTVEGSGRSFWEAIAPFALLILLVVVVGAFLVRRARRGGVGQMGALRKARARAVEPGGVTVTFADVAGADEAVGELHEIKEFLQDPAR
ncbi:MAG: hypothetical protein R2736_22515, partial [Solirubrobacterales bacterium]